MIKVELKMNTDLIVDRGVYVPEAILGGIDDAFQQFGFRKEVYDDGTICFWGNRKRDDFANFGALILALKKESWFMDYVEKWLWYNSDGQYDESSYRIEDILYHYTKRRSA